VITGPGAAKTRFGGSRTLEPLWKPLTIAGVVIPNRVMTSALTLQYGDAGQISDRHLAFYRERARGGVGLVFSEQLAASPLSNSPFSRALRAYDRELIRGFEEIAAELSPYDTRFFAQLFAGGAASSSTIGLDGWSPVRGPSRIGAPDGEMPLPLTRDDIGAIVNHFAQSAKNVQEGGLDGVEIHGSHGWLVGQFLSPLYNRRIDDYGGSVENRCRFAIELGAAVRSAVGRDFPSGISLTYDELMGESGITPEETLQQLRILSDTGLFDFFDLSVGSTHQQHHTIASMAVPEGFALPFAAKAKAQVGRSAAILVAGRVVDPYMAAHAIEEGMADIVGMARAHLADPHLLRKLRFGETEPVIHCVGMNACVRRALQDQPVICALNPVTGRESMWTRLIPARPRRTMAVIGAGPAGMRFSLIAARAGHAVSLYERSGCLGGHLATLARLPSRGGWTTAIHDLERSLTVAGVQVIQGREAMLSELMHSDAVVVATGSTWDVSGESFNRLDRDKIPGRASGQVVALDEAIRAATSSPTSNLGRHVMIVDGTGTFAPLGLAQLLSNRGVGITLVTAHESLGKVALAELELPHIMPILRANGVRVIVSHNIQHIENTSVTLQNVWGGVAQLIEGVDAVVLALSRRPDDALFQKLRALRSAVYCIGDAVSPRPLEAIIYEAEELARSL
jgi:2,4-dienoyl-CoA reductase-like NADH-dependent reductase (Old Yellow Enzyme family)/thioredoxin reductase